MKLFSLVTVAVMALCAMPVRPADATIIIDQFTDGTYTLSVNASSPVAVSDLSGLSGVLGGRRRATLTYTTNPTDTGSVVSDVGFPPDVLDFNAQVGERGSLLLEYGLAGDLNTDLTNGGAENGVDVYFLISDLGSTLSLSVTTQRGTMNEITETVSKVTGSGPQVVHFSFSEFSSANFTDVDLLSLKIDGVLNGDYRVDLIATQMIPEPVTVVGLVAMMAGLGRYMRRRVRKA